MRLVFPLVAALFLAACSETPTETKKKEPEKPSEPITGRQAFQMTFPQARIWAQDCQPIRIRSLNLANPKSGSGRAGAWEIIYVSPARGRQRSYTWSAIEAEGNLHKGVFGGIEEGWGGPRGQEQPFLPAALKIDTPDALQTAILKSREYLDKQGAKPQVTYLCELIPRFPDPVWRVMWGESVSAAEWFVYVYANNREYKGH